MYTTPYCPYCVSAKRLLQREGIAYEDHDVSRDYELRQRIAGQVSWRTVPMIFVDDAFVGGFTELDALHRRGGLAHLKA